MATCSWTYKFILVVIFLLAFGFLYMCPNAFPLFTPRYLPLFGIDRVTPFMPWTFLIYVSDYGLILLVVALLRRKDQIQAFARMAFGVLACCGAFFWLWPTMYPRPAYPAVENPVIAMLMQFILTTDPPHNCFPSMHVALTGVAAWASRYVGRLTHLIFWLWTVSIFVSTLTTKQHYVLDILGGIVVMITIAFLEWWFFSRKQLAPDRYHV